MIHNMYITESYLALIYSVYIIWLSIIYIYIYINTIILMGNMS